MRHRLICLLLPALLILLLLSLGCLPQSRPSSSLAGSSLLRTAIPPERPRFSIATYNVNFGMPRPDLALNAIRAANADVLCLQETTPAWIDYLKPRLADRYPHVLARQWSGAGGLAFFSTVPLHDVEFIKPEAGWFPAWIVIADAPASPVQILNLHLHPQLNDKGSVSVGALVSTPATRRQELQQFHAKLRTDLPTVILGDFNESDSGSAVDWLKAQGFSDALPSFDSNANTWEYRSSLVSLHARFDHIMYSNHLRCLHASVISEGASDHLPVTAVFETR